MSRITKFLLVLVGCTVLLAACATPSTFGIPSDQWATLSSSQKDHAMKQYYKNQAAADKQQAKNDAEVAKIREQNTPVNNIISAFSSIAENQGYGGHHGSGNSQEHKKCITGSFQKTACGYNCYKDDMGEPHCAKYPDQKCVTGSFGKTVCGFNCYKDDFGTPHCAKS